MIRIDHYHHFVIEDSAAVLHLLQRLVTQGTKIMATLDDVVAKVANLGTVEDSVVALLQDIKAKLDAAIASNDPAKLQALSDAIDAQATKLAGAVVENTPAVPAA